jgi:AsmA protein
MNKLLINALKVVIGGTVFAMVAIIIAVLLFDINNFKPEIEAVFFKHAHRQLVIEEDLKLSIFPWLGIATGKVTVKNPPGFDTPVFATFDATDIKVKLTSLLTNHVKISHVILKGAVINLSRTIDGVDNWRPPPVSSKPSDKSEQSKPENDNLSAPTSAQFSVPKDSVTRDIEVQSIAIENAQINWDDQRSNKRYEVNSINLNTGVLSLGKPVAVDINLRIHDHRRNRVSLLDGSVNITVTDDLNSIAIQDLEAIITQEGMQLSEEALLISVKAQVYIDRNEQQFKIPALQLTMGGVRLTAEVSGHKKNRQIEVTGQINLPTMNPRISAAQFGVDLGFIKDQSALTKLSAEMNFHSIGSHATVDELTVVADESTMMGSITVESFSDPMFDFNLSIDKLDLDRYLVKSRKTPKQLSATGANAISKNKLLRPAQQHSANAQVKTEPLTNTAGSKVTEVKSSATSSSVFEMIRGLDANGSLFIQQFKLKGLNMHELNINIQAKDGDIHSQHTIKKLYQGSSTGKIDIDVRKQQPIFVVDEKISRVKIEPLLLDYKGKAKMSGTLNANTQLKARGNDVEQITATLNGKAALQFNNGVVRGFDLRHVISKGERLFDKKVQVQKAKNQTAYEEISGHFFIKNGLVKNDDLLAKAENLRVGGQGTADLKTQQLDYSVTAKIIKKSALKTEAEVVKRSATIYVKGDFQNPEASVDLVSLITAQEKQKIYNKIDKKLGPGVSDLLKRFLH